MTTAQELFTESVTKIIAQGGPSTAELDADDVVCAYRGVNGRACAVGVILTDDEYQSGMEGMGARNLVKCGLLPARLLDHTDLLAALQTAHDNSGFSRANATTASELDPAFLSDFTRRARKIAYQRGLAMPEGLPE